MGSQEVSVAEEKLEAEVRKEASFWRALHAIVMTLAFIFNNSSYILKELLWLPYLIR